MLEKTGGAYEPLDRTGVPCPLPPPPKLRHWGWGDVFQLGGPLGDGLNISMLLLIYDDYISEVMPAGYIISSKCQRDAFT